MKIWGEFGSAQQYHNFPLLVCSLVKSFLSAILQSWHAITHAGTHALQPSPRASLEEIKEEHSECMGKHLLLRTLVSTVERKLILNSM